MNRAENALVAAGLATIAVSILATVRSFQGGSRGGPVLTLWAKRPVLTLWAKGTRADAVG